MGLPVSIKVKLSSETAEAISLTPVVVQELPLRELIENMLGLTGKDTGRIREILLRGTMVSGASRFRWAGWEADAEAIGQLLTTFPDSDPALAFAPERCVHAVLRGGRQAIEIPRDAASRKGLFQRQTFWDVLMASAAGARYAEYSYRYRADVFVREFTAAEVDRVRVGAETVKYSTLRDQIGTVAFSQAELHVKR
jgi:hypothetical protein